MAVKTAAFQSQEAEHEYLFKIRKALMEEGRNISKAEGLLDIAKNLNAPGFDFQCFKND